MFVFPAAHAFYLFATYQPFVLGGGFYGPSSLPYLHVALLSTVATLVCVLFGYAWGRCVRLLYEKYATVAAG